MSRKHQDQNGAAQSVFCCSAFFAVLSALSVLVRPVSAQAEILAVRGSAPQTTKALRIRRGKQRAARKEGL